MTPTRDFDFIIHLEQKNIDNFVQYFQDGYYCDKDAIQDAVKRRSMFNIIDHASGFKADFVVLKDEAFRLEALRGGKAARIIRILPGKDACLYCLQLYREQKNTFIDIPDDPAFPTLRNECNNPIRPASAADLKLIASIASRLLIDHIQNKAGNANHWIWTTEAITGTPLQTPFQLHEQYIGPHPQCPYCHHDKQMHTTIPVEKLAFMQQEVAANPTIETGGVLAGYITPDNEIVITNVSGPGQNSVRSANKFEKDIAYCQSFLNDVYKESSGKYVYIGEWHSHPSKDNRPSGTDLKSLSDISWQKEYLTNHPVMIILSNTGDPSCTVHPAGKRYYFSPLNVASSGKEATN
ncbi:hypothetical protein A4H97_10960 [Niastella yeongjuensis]|uniref:JAB domain-containing protein n=1 Tax=Niastella yeongjuensis TaxID=354355 RepID=A0A1V9EFF5_9BACT|nr:Mov34/MPN/PAD-1 family protein [Niastella yeongjuensis]OQP44869.1 hypothetical protein A4H97_10960 [Niastella yeongjuensis]SEP41760.1 integrative and conjugative element protein, VC0181 family [Niastella yeongjuensis]